MSAIKKENNDIKSARQNLKQAAGLVGLTLVMSVPAAANIAANDVQSHDVQSHNDVAEAIRQAQEKSLVSFLNVDGGTSIPFNLAQQWNNWNNWNDWRNG